MFLFYALILGPKVEKPVQSVTDLVVHAALWKGDERPVEYVAEIASGSRAIAPFPAWLPGPNQTRLEFKIHLDAPTTFLAHISRANSPAEVRLDLDGHDAAHVAITTNTFLSPPIPNPSGPLGDVEQDLWTTVPAGDHLVEIYNMGSGWFEVPEVRIAGLGPKLFHIERQVTRTVHFVEEATMVAPNLSAQVWGVGLGTFPDDDAQSVRDLKISAVDAESRLDKVQDKCGQDFNLLYAEGGPRHPQSLTVHVEGVATLYSRKLVAGAPGKAPVLSASDRKLYTSFPDRTGLETLEGWMTANRLKRGPNELDLDFVQRVLNAMQSSLRYKWDAAAPQGLTPCISRGWGACGDLNTVAIDALRAEGIPARLRPGRNVLNASRPLSPSDDITMHVGAEFWSQGVGWVPMEASTFRGTSLSEGGYLVPSLGSSPGNHLNKHYDYAYLDDTTRCFQLMDWPFGKYDGSWSGFHVDSVFGYETISKEPSSSLKVGG